MMQDAKFTVAAFTSQFVIGIEVLYNVTYKLPRPVKSVSNPKAKISDDKRSVSLRMNLMEIFTKPDDFAFTITY